MSAPSAATIAVVDDNLGTQYSTSRVLEAAGFRVLRASTGTAALGLVTHSPDLFLLDVNLPDVHGFEVCRRLRELPQTKTVPIIHLSASFTSGADQVIGLDTGADGYLVHPVEPPVLVATVRAFLRAREAEAQLRDSEARFREIAESERAARIELDRLGRIKDEFLATLSHELRTPLNAILGWTFLMRRDNRPKTIKEGIDVIERNTRMQSQLISDLLDVSRITAGKLRLDIHSISLGRVVHAALEAVKHAADAKGINVEIVVSDLLPAIRGDPTRLQQMAWNLLSNAIKFTPRGGRVRIVAEQVESHVELTITDTGRGIRAEYLNAIFDRFFQADASATGEHGGLGIGLALVKQIAELHGGRVRASSPGEHGGSTFLVTLPIQAINPSDPPEDSGRPRSSEPLSSGSAELPRLDHLKVLLVDDEPDVLDTVTRLLLECNATVTVAESAQEGLAALKRSPVDLIISDLGMPTIDGFEFMRQVRAQGVETPSLALTAFARDQDRARALQAGFHRYVTKPVDAYTLLDLIAECRDW